MKRALTLLLAFVLVACLFAGCTSNDPAPNTDGGGDEATDNAGNEPRDADDPRAERIKIGFSVSSFENENFVYMDQLMKAYCEENNIDYLTAAHDSDSTKLMEIMENFMAAGVNGFIFQNFEPESCQSTIDEMYEKGIKVISYDAEIENTAGNWICSNYVTGQAIGQVAADFINNELGGVCDYIVMDSQVVFMQERVKGIMDTIAEQCPDSTMVATQRIMLQDAVDTFESMLVANPNVQVLATGYSTCATNIVAAWLPELNRQGADLSQYGVFTCDCTNLDLEYMAQTREGTNILRSTIDLGLKEYVPMGMIEQCEAAIRGLDSDWNNATTQVFPYETVTIDNLDEYAAKYNVSI